MDSITFKDGISATRSTNQPLGHASPGESSASFVSSTKIDEDKVLLMKNIAIRKVNFQQAIEAQKKRNDEVWREEQAFKNASYFSWMYKVIPASNFTERAKLYNAAATAKAKRNFYSDDIRSRLSDVNYLEALSKSPLAPEVKHKKYAQFMEAKKDAGRLQFRAYELEKSLIGASSSTKRRMNVELQDRKDKADKATQKVRELLEEIQKPHNDLKHNVDEVLKYRRTQLSLAEGKEDEKAKALKDDIAMIEKFTEAGGTTSLSQGQAEEFNLLFRDASEKKQVYQKQLQNLKISPNNTSLSTSPQNTTEKDEFEKADRAAIDKLREFTAEGPLALRKKLNDRIERKILQYPAESQEDGFSEEIKQLKSFLESHKLKNLDPKSQEATDIMDLLERSEQQYGMWYKLDDRVRDLSEETEAANKKVAEMRAAQTATTTENIASLTATAAAATTTSTPAANAGGAASLPAAYAASAGPKPGEQAVTKAIQDAEKLATEVNKKLEKFMADAHAAKKAFEEADKELMNKISEMMNLVSTEI